ncbi:MAG: peptide chain release factor N(5)-glutamine methyltransferase [Thermodesulfobacteriota bacterium]|nr:peptide chain release factor N(5)-glutamine methyltransferase [Thermodesulfobacteriota bacterium]
MGSETSRDEPWTIVRLLHWTTDYLSGKGVETPRLDTEVMLADLLGFSRVDLYLNYDRPLQSGELSGFRERVRRRANREPVAYITGRKEFYSLDLEVGPEVLIPRPETELLVEEAVRLVEERWSKCASPRLVDLGAGSGAVVLALALQLRRAELWALDISGRALDLARRNASRHGVEGRINFLQGDLLSPLAGGEENFHLIAANLPYVPRAAFADMAPEARDHEPRLSLDGGEDGLDLIRRAIAQARPLIKPGGALLLEVWPTHVDEIRGLGSRYGYARVRIIKDLAQRDRIAVLEAGEDGN